MDIVAATHLAQEIVFRRRGIKSEKEQRAVHPSYAVSKTQIRIDEAIVQGMLIALSIVIGKHNDLPATEEFIEGNVE